MQRALNKSVISVNKRCDWKNIREKPVGIRIFIKGGNESEKSIVNRRFYKNGI